MNAWVPVATELELIKNATAINVGDVVQYKSKHDRMQYAARMLKQVDGVVIAVVPCAAEVHSYLDSKFPTHRRRFPLKLRKTRSAREVSVPKRVVARAPMVVALEIDLAKAPGRSARLTRTFTIGIRSRFKHARHTTENFFRIWKAFEAAASMSKG